MTRRHGSAHGFGRSDRRTTKTVETSAARAPDESGTTGWRLWLGGASSSTLPFMRHRLAVKQLVRDRVVENLREQVEDHVHAARRELRGFELAAERVDAVGVELRGRLVAQDVVPAPAVASAG